MCLAWANRVRGGFGLFGPRVAFRYRPRFAPRANPTSHPAIRSADQTTLRTPASERLPLPIAKRHTE